MEEETEGGVEHVALVDYLFAVPVRGLALYLPCFGHQWAFGRCTWMNSRDTCWDTRGMFGGFGFIFVGGIWYLVMWTHTLLLLCLHPQLAAQSALVLPLAKWAVEGAVSVFSLDFRLYFLWHRYMLKS